MQLFGVLNASPDSTHSGSVVTSSATAVARAEWLLDNGACGLDVGGQATTTGATVVAKEVEWARLAAIVPALAALGVPLSIDTWRASVARRALCAGATWLNAADGLQSEGMLTVAADVDAPVVVPFLNGPHPLALEHVAASDPVEVMLAWFARALERIEAFSTGLRARCVLDPGTGFGPHGWDWVTRFEYQKRVYSQLWRLRTFGLPLYVALPWKQTAQHDELLAIVLDQGVEYGRAHDPARVRAAAAARGADGATAAPHQW